MKGIRLRYFLVIGIIVSVVLGFSGCNVNGGFSYSAVALNLGQIKALDLSNISSVTLTITGDDMETITSTYDYDTISSANWTINVTVPAGDNRKFEVTADVSNSVNAILGYYGYSEEPVIDKDHATVDINMGIGRMKIIAMNPAYNQLDQSTFPSITVMDDMKGTNWQRIKASDLNWTGTFAPWDCDVDQYGDVLLVNNDTTSGALIKITSLSPVTYVVLPVTSASFISVAVDRENSKIYYASATTLYSCDYDGTNAKTLGGTFSNITGMAFDDGIIYLVDNGATNKIQKYDVKTETVISTSNSVSSTLLSDIMVKGDYVYIADTANKQIVKLNKSDLSVVGTYDGGGNLYGPKHFVGTLNHGICFVDESDSANYDRLIYIDDINGNGYEAFGDSGYGTDQFSFYYVPGI